MEKHPTCFVCRELLPQHAPSQILLCLKCATVEQLILNEPRLTLQAHMFAFEIKLLMAKCLHRSWFHKRTMAGTRMFSKCWWLFLFWQGTGLSLDFTAVVPALHLEKEKAAERGKVICDRWVGEQELASSPGLSLEWVLIAWNRCVSLKWAGSPRRCRWAGLIKTTWLWLSAMKRVPQGQGREVKLLCCQWWKGTESSSPGS